MKLSMCCILRNEGTTVYKMLDSCKTFVDEYVIGIDKTSDDNTETEINRFFTENPQLTTKIVYKYTWNDSFCDARNYGMDKATGDFILIMDGHEYFPERYYNITEGKEMPVIKVMEKIKTMLNNDIDELFVNLYQQPFTGHVPFNYFLQPRIYRNGIGDNGKKIRFGRNSHNVIRNTDPEKQQHFPEAIIIHDAPEENRAWRKEQRIKMNTKRLKDDIKKNNNDARAYFYLGNTRLEAKDHEKAIECYKKYCEIKKENTSEKYQVYYHWGLALHDLERYAESLDKLYMAVRIDPTKRDAYILIGDICQKEGNLEMAIHNYNNALMLKPQMSRMFSNGSINTWMPFERMARAYEKQNDFVNAAAYLKMAMNYVQAPEWADLIKEWSRNNLRILVIDSIGSFTQPLIKSLHDDGNEVISVKSYDKKLAAWADIIWQEWGDQNILQNQYLPKTILRIHGYEAYTNQNILNKINPEHLLGIVCVAKHIAKKIPYPTVKHIQNGVDTSTFYNKAQKRIKDSIGYAGYLNVKKNPLRLAEIIKANPDKNFHLRAEWQDPFLKSSFEYETKDCKNIVWHGRYDNLANFWNQMECVISTSDIESFSFNIAEAMACGCRPYIYNWNGAEEIWGKDWLFQNVGKLSKKCNNTDYRKYIIDNYEEKKQIQKLKDVIYGKSDNV